jgi:2',3'-cyclic-nucleotide 2'-phosphodiesterase
MRILYCGDIVGEAGRRVVLDNLADLRARLGVDFVIVNGENAAHGFGITGKMCEAILEAGADVLVTGNHVWDRPEIVDYIDRQPRLIRPANYPAGTPGRGSGIFPAANGARVLVVQAMGRLFMDPLDDPFAAVEDILARTPLGEGADVVFVDIHAEATSEKMAFGQHFDGRVTAVVGSHTHVPTADAQVLSRGTAYMTDVGMSGDYDSVIGMEKDQAIRRFVRKLPTGRFEPATAEATLCAALIETDGSSGLARCIAPLRMGGRLAAAWPLP